MAKKVPKKALKKTKAASKRTAKTKRTKSIAKKSVKKKKSTSSRRKNPLTKRDRDAFRRMLLEKRRDLVGDMSGIEKGALKTRNGSSGDLSNMPTHLADIGSDNFEQEFTLGLLESECTLLGEIDHALERIEDKTYGICEGTGNPITKARLRAKPWAKYCIEYARMVEQGLVRPGETLQEE